MSISLHALFEGVESFFEQYQFTKDLIVASLGVIFGGMTTVIINRGAIRKQAYFDLQYTILNELIEQVSDLEKSIEHLEIALSFGTGELEPLENEINIVEHKALRLNEIFREKRNLTHRYLTGTMVQVSALIPAKLSNAIYEKDQGSIFSLERKASISNEDIQILRELTDDTRKLKNQITDSLEKLIFPSILSKCGRKLKNIKILLGDLYGIWKVHRSEAKRKV